MEAEQSGSTGRERGGSSWYPSAAAGERGDAEWVTGAASDEAQAESMCSSTRERTAAAGAAAAGISDSGDSVNIPLLRAALCHEACTTPHATRRGRHVLGLTERSSSRKHTMRSTTAARRYGSSGGGSSSSSGRCGSNSHSSGSERRDDCSRSSSRERRDGSSSSSGDQRVAETSQKEGDCVAALYTGIAAAAGAHPEAVAAARPEAAATARPEAAATARPEAAATARSEAAAVAEAEQQPQQPQREKSGLSRRCDGSRSSSSADEERHAQQLSARAAATHLPVRKLPQKRTCEDACSPPQANTAARRVRVLRGAEDSISSADAMTLLVEEGKFCRPEVTLESLQQLNDVQSLLHETNGGKPITLLRYTPDLRKVSLGEGGRELLRACLMLKLEGCNLQGASLQMLLDMAYSSGLWPLAQRIVAERATGKFSPLHLAFNRFKALQARLRKLLNAGGMLVTRGDDGAIEHVVYEPQKSLQLGKDGRMLLKAQLCRYISRFPDKAQLQLEAHGMASVALKRATVPQLLAVAWILDQWNVVVDIVRGQDEIKRRKGRSRRGSPFPSLFSNSRGAALRGADAEKTKTAAAPRCGEGDSSCSRGALTCCSTALPSLDRRTILADGAAVGRKPRESVTDPSTETATAATTTDTAPAAATGTAATTAAGTAKATAPAAARRTAATAGAARIAERSEVPASRSEGTAAALTRGRGGAGVRTAGAVGSIRPDGKLSSERRRSRAPTDCALNEEPAAAAASQRAERSVAAGECRPKQAIVLQQPQANVQQQEEAGQQQQLAAQQQEAAVHQREAVEQQRQQPGHLIEQQDASTCAVDCQEQDRYGSSINTYEETVLREQPTPEVQQQRPYRAASRVQEKTTKPLASDLYHVLQERQHEQQQQKPKRQKHQERKNSGQQQQTQQQQEQLDEDRVVAQAQQEPLVQNSAQMQQQRQRQQPHPGTCRIEQDHSLNVQRVLSVLEQTNMSSSEGPAIARHLLVELLRHVKLGVVAPPPPAVYCKLVEAARSLGVAVSAIDTQN